MKRLLLLLLPLIVFVGVIQSQNDTLFRDFNKSRNKRTEIGLKTLGGWAIANIAASGYLYYNTTGSDKYFHQMNVMWNGINLLFVAPGLIMKQKNDLSLVKTLKGQSNVEALYITNAALDLAYMAGGAYLAERAKSDPLNSAKWNGWGSSVITQGGFLLLLDTTMFIVHKRNGKKLYKMLDKVTISTSGLGIKFGMQI